MSSYPTLAVGCVCAGKLEDNPIHAVRRERLAKRTAKLRSGFTPDWHWSPANNPTFTHRGWRTTCFPSQDGRGWKYVVSYKDDKPHFGRIAFQAQTDAMRAAVNAFIEQQSNWDN